MKTRLASQFYKLDRQDGVALHEKPREVVGVRPVADGFIVTEQEQREIYSYTGPPFDATIVFDVTGLKRAIRSGDVVSWNLMVPLSQPLVDWLISSNGVLESRVSSLTDEDLRNPPVGCIVGDKKHMLLVDGSHRVVRLWRDGHREMTVCHVPESAWRLHSGPDTDEYHESMFKD